MIVYAYYLYIPGWFIWAAGLTPFVMALIARLKHFEQLWWVSITLMAEFLGAGLGVLIYMHQWQRLAFVLAGLFLAAGARAWPWFRHCHRPRHKSV